MRTKGGIILILSLIFLINFISATDDSLHLNIQTTSSGSVVTGTFKFEFNISSASDCSAVVYTNYSTLATDSRGIVSLYLNNINVSFTDDYWLCYYRDGTLMDASRIVRTASSFSAKNVSASGVLNDSNLDLTGKNISVDYGFFQKLNVSLSSFFNGTINALGSIYQTSGINIVTQIVHTGRKENFVGNTGLGQGAGVYNSWYNSTDYIDLIDMSGYGDNYKFSGGVYDGENIWLAASFSPNIVKFNPATEEMTNYSIAGQSGFGARYYGACFDGEKVWFAPFQADNFHTINVRTGERTNYTNGYGSAAFSGCVFDGEKVWFVPEESDSLVYVWANDSKFVNVTDQISSAYAGIAFNGGVFDGESLWLVPYDSDYIVRVNVTDDTLTNYTHGSSFNTYVGGCWDGETVWFAPSFSDTIDGINPTTGEITKIEHGETNDAYIGCTYDGTSVWFAPLKADEIIKFNPETYEIEKIATGEDSESFRGAVFDGETVWLIPFSGDNLWAIRPPEYGLDSLHTRGNANVGQNLSVGSLIKLEITETLPTCGAFYNGTIMRNITGFYGCNTSAEWVKIF